jgi:hypothetical protein
MGKILAKRIKGGTFFKLLLVGSVVTHVVMTLLVMILVASSFFEPTQAGEPMSILKSELFLVAYLVVGAIFAVPIWAGIFWLSMYPGLWIYSRFRLTEINYHES